MAHTRSLIFLRLRIEGEPRYIALFSCAGALEHLHLGEFVGAMVRALEEFYGRRARYVANFTAGMGGREQPDRRRRIRRLYPQNLFLRPRIGWRADQNRNDYPAQDKGNAPFRPEFSIRFTDLRHRFCLAR